MAGYSSKNDIDTIHRELRETFATGLTKDLAWRRWQLKQMWWLLTDNEERIMEALFADLHKPAFEVQFELAGTKNDILSHYKNMEKWLGTKPVSNAGIVMGWLGKGRIRKEPLGTTFIIGAWNFPIGVLLPPLVAAITAGCCACIKPSELAPHTATLLAELVATYLDPRAIRVVTGGAEETTYALTKRWSQIFYTGSSRIGRVVAIAAAKHLTPVVLELGGQGPCIVTKSADIDLAAKRTAWIKFLNAGQICISTNHVFAEPEVVDKFVERLAYWNDQLLSTNVTKRDGVMSGAAQMTRMVNERQFDRLAGLLEKTDGQVVYGGLDKSNRTELFFHPTVVTLGNVSQPKGESAMGDKIMSEELFGPVSPVITATVDEALREINALPEPLALYIFSRDRAVSDHILDNTLSGGVTINNVAIHASLGDAPFGGVGESGYGAYHGPVGVEAFCHRRAVVEPPSWVDGLIGFMYAPYAKDAVAKLAVKNSLGFKRGETLEDQRKRGGQGLLKTAGTVLGFATVVTLWLRGHLLFGKSRS